MTYAAVQPTYRRDLLSSLGVAVTLSDYDICVAQQNALKTAYNAWLDKKAAYDKAVAQRIAQIAADEKQYKADLASYLDAYAKWDLLHKQMITWSQAMAGKYAGYSMTVSSLLRQYTAVKLPKDAPKCVSKDTHEEYVKNCELYKQKAIRGLGLGADFDWSLYNACFVSQYPVCTTDPPKPQDPGPEPQPPTPPVIPDELPPPPPPPMKPTTCTKPAATVAPTPKPPPAPAPAPAPTPAPGPAPEPYTPVTTTAEMLPMESKAGGGLLMAGLLALAVGGGIYLLVRRKRSR